MQKFDYTISSTDCNQNSFIRTNLSGPQTEFCKMTITSLTTMANIVVLSKDDYFVLNGVKYCIDNDYTQVSESSLAEYLNTLLQSTYNVTNIEFFYDTCSRMYIKSTNQLTLTECSYNISLLFGLVNVELPLQSVDVVGDTPSYNTGTHHIQALSDGEEDGGEEEEDEEEDEEVTHILKFPNVGLFLSTPVLYLASNLGSNSYKNTLKNTTSMRILMRITNSFFAKQPISATNGDYTTTVRSSDLSDVRFILMDANYHVIKLLSPMYLTVEIEAIPDKLDYEKDFSQGPINPQELIPMNEYAYMRDLTERGQDVTDSEIPAKIFIQPPEAPQQQTT